MFIKISGTAIKEHIGVSELNDPTVFISLPIHKNLNKDKVVSLSECKGRFNKDTNDLYLIAPVGWGYNIEFLNLDTGETIGKIFTTKLLNGMVVINDALTVCTDENKQSHLIQYESCIVESVTTDELKKWMEKYAR